MNFPTITRYNWMCCSIILVFLALSSPKPLQAQENQKERITIKVFLWRSHSEPERTS